MNDFISGNTGLDQTPSTVIDTGSPAPGSAEFRPDAQPVEADAGKPLSLDDAMAKAVEDTKAAGEDAGKDAKAKPEKEAKAKPDANAEVKTDKPARERAPNGKFAKAAEVEVADQNPDSAAAVEGGEDGPDDGDAARPSEGRDIDRAPAHFLPRAKEKWAGVDPDVRGEVYRTIENLEKGIEIGREDREFRKSLRQFEDMATQAGTTVPAAIANYVRIDQELRANPERALAEILKTINLTPQQYAQHVLGQEQMRAKNPQAYAQNQQTQQLQGQIQALQQQIQQLTQGSMQEREAARVASIERDVIAPFRAEHPRYDELQEDIAFFLNSDKIPSTLNERQRLEAAYDMAERINPAPSYGSPERLDPAQNAQRPINPAGSKSVKGSPSYGATAPKKNAKLSLDEAVKMAFAKSGL